MIQHASDTDLAQIIAIQKQSLFDFTQINDSDYLSNIKKVGFTVMPFSLEELNFDKDKILLVNKIDDQVLGFIWISPVTDNHSYLWFGPKIKSRIHSQKIYKIKSLVVLSEVDQNLAIELLEFSYSLLKDEYIKFIVSAVAFNPVINLSALNFYEKQNFIKAAVSQPVPYQTFGNYQYLLYSKKI